MASSGAKTAYIVFCAEVEDNTAQALFDVIAGLPANTGTIYLLLSTPGGSVAYGFAVYNLLRALPHKIIIHNIGSVDSIGVTIFLAADERYANANGTFLIHPVQGHLRTDTMRIGQLEEKLNCITTEENKIRQVITARSNISQKELGQLMASGELKDAEYALDKELIHDIREMRIPKGAKLHVVKATTPGAQ